MLNRYEPNSTLHRRRAPVDYDFIGSSVHHFVLTSRALDAIMDWRRKVDYVYSGASYRTILTLTDARRTTLPPLAFATHLSDLWLAHTQHPLYSRNAILHPDVPLNEVAEEALRSLPGCDNQFVRFFSPDKRHEAVRWLISQD